MKVVGFSFIRNAIKYDYPIVEAITSILPICDEFVVALGHSDDETKQLIKSIDSSKIKIIPTIWNDELREGGFVLAEETNKAFQAISEDANWAFYIQGDEVIHEKYLKNIKTAMLQWKDDPKVDGLLFEYLHFYGSFDYVGASSKWYEKEIRIIKNNKNFYSYRDAQGFRKYENKKLNVKKVEAFVYHYGWVKPPSAMQAKQEYFNKLWHSDQWVDKNVIIASEFDYSQIDALNKFQGTHPKVMESRIHEKNWKFDFDLTKNSLSTKERAKNILKRVFGIDFSYKNYKIK